MSSMHKLVTPDHLLQVSLWYLYSPFISYSDTITYIMVERNRRYYNKLIDAIHVFVYRDIETVHLQKYTHVWYCHRKLESSHVSVQDASCMKSKIIYLYCHQCIHIFISGACSYFLWFSKIGKIVFGITLASLWIGGHNLLMQVSLIDVDRLQYITV